MQGSGELEAAPQSEATGRASAASLHALMPRGWGPLQQTATSSPAVCPLIQLSSDVPTPYDQLCTLPDDQHFCQGSYSSILGYTGLLR